MGAVAHCNARAGTPRVWVIGCAREFAIYLGIAAPLRPMADIAIQGYAVGIQLTVHGTRSVLVCTPVA